MRTYQVFLREWYSQALLLRDSSLSTYTIRSNTTYGISTFKLLLMWTCKNTMRKRTFTLWHAFMLFWWKSHKISIRIIFISIIIYSTYSSNPPYTLMITCKQYKNIDLPQKVNIRHTRLENTAHTPSATTSK